MHRVEQRVRRDRLKHLPCGRHIMHFIEIEFFRRRHADQKCGVCSDQDNTDKSDAPRSKLVENRR
jgi:hypothetical protein